MAKDAATDVIAIPKAGAVNLLKHADRGGTQKSMSDSCVNQICPFPIRTVPCADLIRIRNRAGGSPNSRLNARLKAGSDL